MLHRYKLIILAFVLLAPSVPALSMEVIRHTYSSQEPDAQFEEILYLTIAVHLTTRGYSSTKTSENAPYILLTEYTVRGSEADLVFSLLDAGLIDSERARYSVTVQIDYTLEGALDQAIDELLAEARLDEESTDVQHTQTAIEGVLSRKDGPSMSPDEILAARATRLYVGAGIQGIAFFGEISDYFGYGAGGIITAGIRKSRERWSVTAGLKLSSQILFTENGISGGPVYLSLAGADLTIGTGYNRNYRVSAGISGGGAFISLEGDGALLTKTVPYMDGGIQLAIPVGSSMCAVLDIRALAVFDQDFLILAATPALSIRKEFIP